jgi:hypothetical protein
MVLLATSHFRSCVYGRTGQVPRCVVVDRCRVLQHDEVEPAASPFPAGRDTPFPADLLQFLADLAGIFCLEDTLTDSCLGIVSGVQLKSSGAETYCVRLGNAD